MLQQQLVQLVLSLSVATELGQHSKWVVVVVISNVLQWSVCTCPGVGADSQHAPSKAQATHGAGHSHDSARCVCT